MFAIANRCLVLGFAAVLAACATVPPHSLTDNDFQKYRIADVSVEGVEVVRSWPVEEEIYLRSGRAAPDVASRLQSEPASNFPDLQAHIQRALTDRLKMEFASQVSPMFTGTRPVRAMVRLKAFDVPSTTRRVLVDDQAKMKADIVLVDAGSGATVLSYEGPHRTRKLFGGLLTPIAVALDKSDAGYAIISDYMTTYRSWLLRT